jgi:nitroreductase
MNVYEAIFMRRSIRRFKPAPIPEEKLHKIMEAARLAPSAGNLQPWIFIVGKDKVMREKLAEAADNQYCIAGVPVIIAVFGDPDSSPSNYQRDPHDSF